MNCKECIHYEVCQYDGELCDNPDMCKFFKPKSRFVELPCEVGTKVAVITSQTSNGKNLYIFEDIVSHFIITDTFVFMAVQNHLSIPNYNWHNVFYGDNAREEAEKALKERESE